MTAAAVAHPIVAFASGQAEILAAIYVDKIREAFLRLGRRSGP